MYVEYHLQTKAHMEHFKCELTELYLEPANTMYSNMFFLII